MICIAKIVNINICIVFLGELTFNYWWDRGKRPCQHKHFIQLRELE